MLRPPDVLVNPGVLGRLPDLTRTRGPLGFHRRLPGYRATPLVSCPELAARLGVAELLVKDESSRLGLPAFKMLGASYAIYRELVSRLGREVDWETIGQFAEALTSLGRLKLCAATDGNHGRAVARMARLLGLDALIFVPDGTAQPRIDAIVSEGARVEVIAGGYDAAVEHCARQQSETCIVVSDTSWPGYTQIPGWVMEGYSTIFAEISDQLAEAGRAGPDVAVVPVGVGGLAAAAIRYLKSAEADAEADADADADAGRAVTVLGVEPESARCVTESLRAGRPVVLPFPQTSIMAGLNCGTPSGMAWPVLASGVDVMVSIGDEWAEAAVRTLAGERIVAGETGAAALAGLEAICADPAGAPARAALRLGRGSRVLLLCTEGATDPAAWSRITGRRLTEPVSRT